MSRIAVIGIAGGIGSGKSEVARILERLGAVVIDSDVQARAALELPAVRGELVRWWGPRVVGEDGKVDRKFIADIVFADAKERRRLEGLVHPLVKAKRAGVIEEARRKGAKMAVIDAPLLFEAGVDAECDAVVFVDAPLGLRVERVRKTRGWDAGELERRERGQMDLKEKRARSKYVITNDGDRESLARQVEAVFREMTGVE